MHHRLTPLALLCVAVTAVHAQSESVTLPFSYSPVDDFRQVLDVPQFDTQGGTRVLESIGIEMTSNYSVQLTFENTSDDALGAGDYVYEHINAGTLGFGDFGGAGGGDDEGDPDDPFPFGRGDEGGGGPSNVFIDTGFFTLFDAEQSLAPFDGTAGVDAADQVTQFFSSDLMYQQVFGPNDNPALTGVLTGPGSVDLSIAGIIENFFQLNFIPDWGPGSGIFGQPLYPTDEALWFRLQDYSHSGTVTLTYNFVPAPGALGALGLSGLALAIRRRR